MRHTTLMHTACTQVEITDGTESFLILLPEKFKKVFWMRKGNYVIADHTIHEKIKGLRGILVKVLQEENIKDTKKDGTWYLDNFSPFLKVRFSCWLLFYHRAPTFRPEVFSDAVKTKAEVKNNVVIEEQDLLFANPNRKRNTYFVEEDEDEDEDENNEEGEEEDGEEEEEEEEENKE